MAELQDQIVRVVTYRQPIDRVWAAITHPDNLVHWMCTGVRPFSLEPGETIHFAWHEERYRAIIEFVDPPHTFSWRWRPGGGEDPEIPLEQQGPMTRVRFALESIDGGTRLTLTETGFAALTVERNLVALAENNGGWDDCLEKLDLLLGLGELQEVV